MTFQRIFGFCHLCIYSFSIVINTYIVGKYKFIHRFLNINIKHKYDLFSSHHTVQCSIVYSFRRILSVAGCLLGFTYCIGLFKRFGGNSPRKKVRHGSFLPDYSVPCFEEESIPTAVFTK